VDVLLLYNTFRVLGPAFDAASTARSAASSRRIDSIASAGNLEKYGMSVSPTYRAAMEEKIKHYRNDSSLSQNSYFTSSSKSTKPLIPTVLYGGQASPSFIDRSITPISYGGWDVVSPIPAVSPLRTSSRDLATHIRNDSFSSRGLPAPPRPSRSPVTSEPMPDFPVPKQYDVAAYSLEADSWITRQRSMRTFGHEDSAEQKSPSLFSDDGLKAGAWPSPTYRQASLQSPDGKLDGQPIFSAVAPSFPTRVYQPSPPQSATLERSMSAGLGSRSNSPSSPATHRPLLLARSSPDMRIAQTISPRPF